MTNEEKIARTVIHIKRVNEMARHKTTSTNVTPAFTNEDLATYFNYTIYDNVVILDIKENILRQDMEISAYDAVLHYNYNKKTIDVNKIRVCFETNGKVTDIYLTYSQRTLVHIDTSKEIKGAKIECLKDIVDCVNGICNMDLSF